MGERLRCRQLPKSSSVKAVRKEVVVRRRYSVLLLFKKWLEIELEEEHLKSAITWCVWFFPLERGKVEGSG